MLKQIGVRLDEDFIKQVKLKALEENTTFQEIVTKALKYYMTPNNQSKKLAKLANELYEHQIKVKNILQWPNEELKRIDESGE
jgi:hypothetical protein